MATADDFKYVVTPEEEKPVTQWGASPGGKIVQQQEGAVVDEGTRTQAAGDETKDLQAVSDRVKQSGPMTGVGFNGAVAKAPAQVSAPEPDPEPAPTYSAGSYDEMLKILNDRRDRIKSDAKKERRDRLIYAIGDGISALAGLFSAAKGGGASVYSTKVNMSNSNKETWDQLKALRKEEEDGYLNDYLKVMQAKRADEIAETNAWYKKEMMRQRGEKLQADLAYKQTQIDKLVAEGKVAEARALYVQAQTEYNQARTQGVVIDNKYKPRIAEANINQKNASASAAYARAAQTMNGTVETVEETKPNKFGEMETTRKTVTKGPAGGGKKTSKKQSLPKGKKALPTA